MCSSAVDVSHQIVRSGEYVTLPALQDFLPKDQDPPSFVSGARVYAAEGQSNLTVMPTTSVSNGTNLPNIAEIYYLYYDVCRDRDSMFDKRDPGRWTALKGQFQFCVQHIPQIWYNRLNANSEARYSTALNSSTNLNWYRTTKNHTAAFCTRVDSEEEDFCVGESVMESLGLKMSSIFNTTTIFTDLNLTDITYSAKWGPKLVDDILGARDSTSFPCQEHGLRILTDLLQQMADNLGFVYVISLARLHGSSLTLRVYVIVDPRLTKST